MNSPHHAEELVVELNGSLKKVTPYELLKIVKSLKDKFQNFKDENMGDRKGQQEVHEDLLQTLIEIKNRQQQRHIARNQIGGPYHKKRDIIQVDNKQNKSQEKYDSSFANTNDYYNISSYDT